MQQDRELYKRLGALVLALVLAGGPVAAVQAADPGAPDLSDPAAEGSEFNQSGLAAQIEALLKSLPEPGQPAAVVKPAAKRPSAATAPTMIKGDVPTVDLFTPSAKPYIVGVNDILEVSVLEPEAILRDVLVAPDGTITFPYIGSVPVKGLDVPQIQRIVETALSDGFLQHPVVLVSLKQSNSKQYMVYGEVNRPGAFPLEEYSTVMRAISMAGGFTKYGSSSRVKILRPREGSPGYDMIKIDISKVMDGDSSQDILIKVGDMIVVSEGVF